MRWGPVDWVVLVLTMTVAVSFIITAVVPIILGQPISDARAKVLGGIATSTVAVISVYVGSKLNRKDDDD